jgi:methyl-accepting chemotaxis protein
LKNISIKTQTISLVISSLLLLSAILTFVAINESKDALMEKSYNSLTSARDSKSNQIQNFFQNKINNIDIIAKSEIVKGITKDLITVSQELDVKATDKYPINNSFVKKETAAYEKYFHNYIKVCGYYDIFIIDVNNGQVMYTVAKESDYGANLIYGSLKKSGLAKAYEKVKRLKRIVFVDMEPYAPSANEPAMFLGAPVYINGELKTIVVFQISDKSIKDIMQFREGYGETQEDYLVGQDKLMRSDSFLDPKGHSLKASFANPSLGKCDTEASREALQGTSNTKIIIDYNGNPVLSAYKAIEVGQDLKWALISEIDEAEVLITPNSIRNKLIIYATFILIVIIFITFVVVSFSVIKPLDRFKTKILEISTNHDLSQRIDTNAPSEIMDMGKSLNTLLCSLQELIATSKNSSTENASISYELSTTALEVGNNVKNSVSIIEEATSKAKLAQNEILHVMEEAQESKADIVKANENLETARDNIISLTSKVQETAQSELELAQNMQNLSKEANEVKIILVIIGDIADQTNLLALNAAIEAARAGEHGRGFAVVADEVRKLAERTQKTLSEINATISVVVQSIEDASTNMSTNSEEIQELASIAQGVEQNINETVEIVNQAVSANDNTVKDFEATSKDVETIIEKIDEINDISLTNARSVDNIASAAEHLSVLTNDLNSELETFKT